MTYVVALTGGIGCGKSTIETKFKELGAGIIDCDLIARELQQPRKAGYVYIEEMFGDAFVRFSEGVDRTLLRNLVFKNKEAKTKLEALMSPLIYHVVTERIELMKDQYPYLILTIPLLFESKTFPKLVDRILVVDCPESDQVSRVMARNNMTANEVERIMSTQVSRLSRIMKADDLLKNYNCVPEDLTDEIINLNKTYTTLANEKKETLTVN